MKIGVVLPSRGMIFSETVDALHRELRGYDYEVFISSNRVIPDAHNELVRMALEQGVTDILMLEEDIVLPENAISKMLGKGDIVAIDYGVNGWSCITKSKGEILWCGVGCTLIKREVFESMEYPWFRSDKGLLLNVWPEIKWIDMGEQNYGGQDIWFCMHAREKGFKIIQAEGEARHLKLESLGRPEINNGRHSVLDKPRISKHNEL